MPSTVHELAHEKATVMLAALEVTLEEVVMTHTVLVVLREHVCSVADELAAPL